MARFSEVDLLAKAVVGGALILVLVLILLWWRTRAEDADVRAAVLPRCIERLGSRVACEEQMSKNHRSCLNYTTTRSRFAPTSFDRAGYLECIIAGPEPWAAAGRAARATRAAEDRRDGVPKP